MAVKTGYATAPPPLRAAKPPECAAPARRTAEFRSRKFLAICGKNADNKFRYAGVCKGRVFLASEKFNPVRECGPGFRKNLKRHSTMICLKTFLLPNIPSALFQTPNVLCALFL